MVDFPTSIFDLDDASDSEFLPELHQGVGHIQSHNAFRDEIAAAQTKVGKSESSAQDVPVANTVLLSLTNDNSKWGKVTADHMAAGATMLKIAEATGTGASGVLTFSSIPATFGVLHLVYYGRSTVSSTIANVLMTINGNTTAADYDYEYGQAAASAVTTSENLGAVANIAAGPVPGANSPSNLHASALLWLPEYAQASGMKTAHGVHGGQFDLTTGNFRPQFMSAVFEPTGAISSIALALSSGNWTTTSKARLYGLPA